MVMEIGAKDVDSPAGRALAKKAALEGIVLLKNDRSILPMDGVFAFVCVCVCVFIARFSHSCSHTEMTNLRGEQVRRDGRTRRLRS